MIRLSCIQVRALMDQRSQGLSDADRLRLESHTASCSACSETSALLSNLVSLAQSAPSGSSDAARQRTIARALSHPIAPETIAPSPALWPRWALSGGLVFALALVVLVLRPAEDQASIVSVDSAAPRATSSAVSAEATSVAHKPVSPVRFEASTARRVDVEGATLELSEHSAVEWDAVTARVTLQRGSVRAVVASRAGKSPFSVRTKTFDVIVVGTDFQVSETSVTVHEGVVRVHDLNGNVLREALRTGEVWSRDALTAVSEIARTNNTAGNVQAPSGVQAPSSVLAPQWIDEARTLLASGDVSRSRQALKRAERAALTTTQRLEVATLLAETYQVAGENRRAIAQYDRVRALDPASTAADNADFAAARLTLSSGDRVGARTRFERYLKAHSAGRFRAEAERVLSSLRVTDETTTRSPP